MRIVSGVCRGRVIHPPKNLRARPTTDFAKENLFNVLMNYIDTDGINVLDLFSGTGSISYEFASRGASSVVSVEINAVHQRFIVDTAKSLGLNSIYSIKANAFRYIQSCGKKFDLIFADPPYDIEGSAEIPNQIFERELLSEEGILVMEHSKNIDFKEYPHFLFQRAYGSVHFSFFQRS